MGAKQPLGVRGRPLLGGKTVPLSRALQPLSLGTILTYFLYSPCVELDHRQCCPQATPSSPWRPSCAGLRERRNGVPGTARVLSQQTDVSHQRAEGEHAGLRGILLTSSIFPCAGERSPRAPAAGQTFPPLPVGKGERATDGAAASGDGNLSTTPCTVTRNAPPPLKQPLPVWETRGSRSPAPPPLPAPPGDAAPTAASAPPRGTRTDAGRGSSASGRTALSGEPGLLRAATLTASPVTSAAPGNTVITAKGF